MQSGIACLLSKISKCLVFVWALSDILPTIIVTIRVCEIITNYAFYDPTCLGYSYYELLILCSVTELYMKGSNWF